MKKVVTVVGKNGAEYTVPLTGVEANYYLRLALMRASSDQDLMKEFSELVINRSQQDANRAQVTVSSTHDVMHEYQDFIMSKSQQDAQQNKDQYN